MKITTHPKVKKLQLLSRIIKKLKSEGKVVVLCHGVFDLIHPGHIRHFISAKESGDVLVVTITADRFVKKGPGRPAFNEALRAEVLATLVPIDYVAIVPAETALTAIDTLKPNIYVKGPDYKNRKPDPKIPRRLGDEQKAVEAYGGRLVYTDDIVFSSSHLLNEHFEVFSPQTKAFLTRIKEKYSDRDIIDQLTKLKNSKILVIGDSIIDEYVYTNPLGKSSKEPNVVHRYTTEESFAGGALATANHIAAFSDRVTLVTLLGGKNTHESFISKHMRPTIKVKSFYRDDASTIVKRRYIDKYSNQKLFHVSFIKDTNISTSLEKLVFSFLAREISKYECIVVNDFGHGFLTNKLIDLLSKKSKFLALNVQANSANYGFNVITKYAKADFVCIDEMELRLATHDQYGSLPDLLKEIYTKLRCKAIIATRGPQGSIFYSKSSDFVEAPSLTREVIDRVGAGDALFSATAPCIWSHMTPEVVSLVGNAASALKIATVGNKSPIDFTELTKFITRLLK